MAVVLAGAGCAAAFFGASELETGGVRPVSLVPLVAGVAAVVTLVAHQYRARRPLMPVRQLATTFPVTGILIALCASAAAFGLMELARTALKSQSPTRTALLFLPEFGAAVVTAALFGLLFRTRYTPVLAISGLAVTAAAGALLTAVATGADVVVATGAALIGFGVGASVSPALFMAGFSLRSAQVQRIFALIELLRGVTAFLVAPILLFLATAIGPTQAAGIRSAMWICFGIAGAGCLLSVTVFWLGGNRLRTPDLERWTGGEPAWESAPLLSRLRCARPANPAPSGRVTVRYERGQQ